MLIFEICLPLEEPLVVNFGETRAHFPRKCAVVQGMNLEQSHPKNTNCFGYTHLLILPLKIVNLTFFT